MRLRFIVWRITEREPVNSRTFHRNALPVDYFETGEEDVQAQRVQHELLLELAKTGSGIQIKPILEALQVDQVQTEPLLITLDGVIVNGNRRLAAMRELFHEDPARYQCFQNVQAMVLPEVTGNDVRRIEVKLQMRPETRLPYDWTDQALAVRDLQLRGIQKSEIVTLMRLAKDSDVDAIVERLSEAEIYLADFLGAREEYGAVGDQEQQFIELQKGLRAKTSAAEKELARKLCHVVTRHSRELGTRAYDCRLAYGAKTVEVATRLAERLDVDATPVTDVPAADGSADDLFGDVSALGVRGLDFSRLEEVLRDHNRSIDIAQQIKDVCEELRDAANEQDRGRRPQKKLEQALRTLNTLDLEEADQGTYPALTTGLEAIIERAQHLLTELQTRQE